MCDDYDDLPPVRNLTQPGKEFPCDHTVQTGIRLIQNEKRRIGYQFLRDGNTPQLSAGHLGHKPRGDRCKPQHVHDLSDSLVSVLRLDLIRCAKLCRIVNGTENRIVSPDQILLRNKSDPVFHQIIMLVNIDTVQINIRIRFFIAYDRIHKSGLSRSGTAQEQDHGPVGDIHCNILKKILLFAQTADSTLPQSDTETGPGRCHGVHCIADTGNLCRRHAGLPAAQKADVFFGLIFSDSQNEQGDPLRQKPENDPSPFQVKEEDNPHKNPDPVYIKSDKHHQRDQGDHDHLPHVVRIGWKDPGHIIEDLQHGTAYAVPLHFQ